MREARGTVKSFSKETGEGVILIETGYELVFTTMFTFYADMTATRDVVVGDTALVSIVLNSMGKRRAQSVVLDRLPLKPLSFTAAFKELQTLGFLAEWKLGDAKRVVTSVHGALPKHFTHEHSLELLSAYYGTGPTEHALKEGYLAHDRRFGQETNDIVAELVRVLHCPPATVIRSDSEGLLVRDDADPTIEIAVKDDIRALAKFFQGRFEALKLPRRIVELTTDGDWFAFVVRDESAIVTLVKARAIAAVLV